MRGAVCRLFVKVHSNGREIGGELHQTTAFLAPYDLQGNIVNFEKAATYIADALSKVEVLDSVIVRDVLSSDIRERVESLISNRERYWPFMTHDEVNERMKWNEFQTRQSARIDAIWQPVRKRMYLIMDIIREVDLPVSSPHFHEATESAWLARTREHYRGLETMKANCRQEERQAFDAFRGTYTWQALEKIKMRGCQLRHVQDLDSFLERYFTLDAKPSGIEHHYEEARNAFDAAVQFQYDLERGK